ncbi:hypothetical protein [Thalassotalea maritima]|uniref:hypothetical protein n=1 Tax=Thalassotalea maritima TaxID=3242416 RepID=UPI0035272056
MMKLTLILSLMLVLSVLLVAYEKLSYLTIIITLVLYVLVLLVLFKKVQRPSAEITEGKLFIHTGLLNQQVIDKCLLESARYEVGHKQRIQDPLAPSVLGMKARKFIDAEMHVLTVKLKGFNEWKIYIKEIDNHIDNLRLYNFINANFYRLALTKNIQ